MTTEKVLLLKQDAEALLEKWYPGEYTREWNSDYPDLQMATIETLQHDQFGISINIGQHSLISGFMRGICDVADTHKSDMYGIAGSDEKYTPFIKLVLTLNQ